MYTEPSMTSLKLANTCLKLLERAAKLEFASLVWKTKAQPLYHTRDYLAGTVGIEPTTGRLTAVCSAAELHANILG